MVLLSAQVPCIWVFSSKSSRKLTELDVQGEMLVIFGTILVSCSLLYHLMELADLICFTCMITESCTVASCFKFCVMWSWHRHNVHGVIFCWWSFWCSFLLAWYFYLWLTIWCCNVILGLIVICQVLHGLVMLNLTNLQERFNV